MSTPEAKNVMAEGQRVLRTWIDGRSSQGHPVRDEFARVCLSAVLRRLAFFGNEDALQRYPSRDLLQFQTMCSGGLAVLLARISATRAVVDADHEALSVIAQSGYADAMIGWYAEIERMDATQAAQHLAGIAGRDEELASARLVVARRHPQLIAADWVWDVPSRLPMIGYALSLAVLRSRPDLFTSTGEWLARNREALFSGEPDDLLAPLVAGSAQRPGTTLAPFEGFYGEPTILAAAEWHLEHGEPQAAVELCDRIRVLSAQWDQARQLESAARVELGDLDGARTAARAIDDPLVADGAHLRIAAADPKHLGPAELEALLGRCPATRPETFFAGLQLLLKRGGLAQARALCARRATEFAGYAPLRDAIAVITRVSG